MILGKVCNNANQTKQKSHFWLAEMAFYHKFLLGHINLPHICPSLLLIGDVETAGIQIPGQRRY